MCSKHDSSVRYADLPVRNFRVRVRPRTSCHALRGKDDDRVTVDEARVDKTSTFRDPPVSRRETTS